MNRGYGSGFSLKMAIQDKHCLISTTRTMRIELEKLKKKCANTLYTEGEAFNPTLKIVEPEEARQLEIQSIFQADDAH